MRIGLGFLVSGLCTLGIPLLLGRRYRGTTKLGAQTPLMILLHWSFLSVFSTLLSRGVSYGFLMSLVAILLASAATFVMGRLEVHGDPNANGTLPWSKVGVAAFLCVVDGWLLFHFNSWGIEAESIPTLRAPFNNDAERNLVLVNALIRGDGNPFLYGSKLVYQVFWHRWAALFVAPFSGISNYSLLAGCNLTTSLFFYWVAFWLMAIKVPWIFERWSRVMVCVALLASHAEIVNVMSSLLQRGVVGMEVDWSYASPLYFRFISSKLLGLIAPQHLFFLTTLLLALGSLSSQSSLLILGILSFLISPVLFILSAISVFPGWVFFYARRTSGKSLIYFVVALLVAVATHSVLAQNSPLKIFSVARADELWVLPFLSGMSQRWLLIWMGSVGFLCFSLVFGGLGFLKSERRSARFQWVAILSCGVIFNGLITNAELRRHASMLMVVLSIALFIESLPFSKWAWRFWRTAAALALVLHGIFIHAYSPLGKPTGYSAQINYADYFHMNQLIKKNLNGVPVYAASSSELGLPMPIVAEVATTFVEPLWAGVHGIISNEQRSVLAKLRGPSDFIRNGPSLGYRYVLWGPIEERVWGEPVRRELFELGREIEAVGTVRLISLEPRNLKSSGELVS